MISLEDLATTVECQALVHRFARFRDQPEGITFDDVFTPDIAFHAPPDHPMLGPNGLQGDALRALMTDGPVVPFHVIHIFTNVLIEPTGPDTATGAAYMIEYSIRAGVDEPLPRAMPSTPDLIGDRLFEFRRTEAGWRICRYEIFPVLSREVAPS